MHRRAVVLALLAAARSAHAIPKEFYSNSRDNGVCPKKDLEACPSSLPSGFCCPSGQQCLSLAGATTALCCPKSRSCEKVWPIACDVRLQDPKENPDATIITSVFDVALETCANGCCPFGYACADGADATPAKRVCVRNANQSKKPGDEGGSGSKSSSSSSASSTAAATSTASATATDIATSSQTASATATATSTPESSSSDADNAEKGIKSKTMSIIGGVVGATLVLLIIIVVGILCVRRRRKRAADPLREKTGYHRAAGSVTSSVRARGLYISEPILQENSYRSDFILKSPSAASSISQRPVNSRWSGGVGGGGGVGVVPPRIPTPSSNRQQQQQRRDDPEFPNPFSSPNPSMAEDRRYSLASSDMFDETGLRTGHVVTGKPAPIRNMRPSSRRISREPQHFHAMADERINVFSDEYAVPQQQQQQQQYPYQQRDDAYGGPKDRMTRMTTFSQLMDKADLGDLYRGKRYVPGTPPRL
ncbi:hypothetical protein MY11210_008542 [Beauveria gryllotalpidicola]